MTPTIKTNHKPRPILYSCELTEEEKQDFDYIDFDDENECNSFFRFKDKIYDLGEFMRVPPKSGLNGFDGYISDSYFSGVLIKYTSDNDFVVVSQYFI